MKITKTIFTLMLSGLAMFSAAPLLADSLELANGDVLEGEFVGSSNDIIMFRVGGEIEAFPEADVVGIFLSSGVETREQEAQSESITIPAGTRMVIRMTDSIDSSRHRPGHRFRGQLEGALAVNGQSVVPRGTIVHGRITQASASGRVAGSAELAIEFTDLLIDDQLIPIATTNLRAQGSNEAARTAGRTARAMALGALVDGRSGARTGMKVGAGASILMGGSALSVPAGTMIDTELRVDLTL